MSPVSQINTPMPFISFLNEGVTRDPKKYKLKLQEITKTYKIIFLTKTLYFLFLPKNIKKAYANIRKIF